MPERPDASRTITGDGSTLRATADRPPSVTARPDGDRVLVTVRGELGPGDCDLLGRTVRAALAGPAHGVDLDLSAVGSCDCSVLNVLLTSRRQARAAGRTVVVTATGAAAERLMALTDTRSLFEPGQESGPGSPPTAPVDGGTGLRAEVVQLRRAMLTRPEIDLARGILMASFGLSADEAWDVLVMASQNTNTKLYRLATNVVTTVRGSPLPAPVRRHLTTAVAAVTAGGKRGPVRAARRPSPKGSGRTGSSPAREAPSPSHCQSSPLTMFPSGPLRPDAVALSSAGARRPRTGIGAGVRGTPPFMSLNHDEAPVLDALARYHEAGELGFTPPGHKQARGADPRAREVLGDAVYLGDVLSNGGLDDRLSRGRVLERAEELMADAVHAEHTFFSTCGSSLSVKAAMLTVTRPGSSLLVGRDAHKSVIAGLILSGVRPVWVEPAWDGERHIAHPPPAAAFDKAFAEHPEADGALVTSPTPYGSAADLHAISDICHRHGKPLIVDEAWGAHLPFHDGLPSWAMDAGADICVTSIHKMGSGLEQGSVFHLQGDLVDPAELASRADLLGTTSPSVLLYAGIDAWRRQMVQHGEELIGRVLELAARTRAAIEEIDGFHVHDARDFCGPGLAADFDPLPCVMDIGALGTTGYRAADWLREHHHMDMHLFDHRRLGAQLTHADDEDTTARLLGALRDLAAHAGDLRDAPGVEVPAPAELRMTQIRLPRDAYFARHADVPVEKAEGRIAGEMITPYPPGIPAVLPGERLTGPVLRYLATGVAAGMNLPDAADKGLTTIRVVARTDED
jgi:arginine decarboxylase